jgi:hypothetical protein
VIQYYLTKLCCYNLNFVNRARGPALREALERQYGMNGQPPIDPDSIFHEVCVLYYSSIVFMFIMYCILGTDLLT